MSDFVDYLEELFEAFGPVRSRKMFGGHGVYHDGVMFGLVADEMLYLKVDDALAAEFAARGLGPFQFLKGDRVVEMSYYEAPPEIFDDPAEAAAWARRAYEVAVVAKAGRKR